MSAMTFENDAVLYASDSHGVYIPRYFAQSIVRENVQGIDESQFEVLIDGPYNPWYWEVWDEVLNDARVIGNSGIVYFLYQDGDLWLVPEGVEIPEGF